MSKKYKTFPANPYPLGVRREGKDILVSMVSEVEDCGVLLYSNRNKNGAEDEPLKISFPQHQHVGQVYSMKVEGVPAHYNEYRLYQGEDVFVDEYGTCYKTYPFGTLMAADEMKGVFDSQSFDWEGDAKPGVSFADAVFYGLHVRGFTVSADSKCRHKGTFAGVQEKLDYLHDLGITSIILMPAYEFIENEKISALRSSQSDKRAAGNDTDVNNLNYWGYKPAFYYAPKASYTSGKNPCVEFKQLVKSCHEKGMELFMQFYFPVEMSDAEMVRILEFWAMEYHVDGFQIITEKEDIVAVQNSPILADTKLIFREFRDEEGFANKARTSGSIGIRASIGSGKQGATEKRLCVYRDDTMRDFRRFLKGDDFMLDAVMYHFSKNDTKKAYMNSIADYHGFRLADLVSYDYKHNEVNGEENTDGTDYNNSWNCGVEGPTDNTRILALRKQQIKNALSLILLSQGAPYLFMGDEMGSTQYGNNNPYNQDNEISWLDWKGLKQNKEIYQYTKDLLAYRKANKILHMDTPLDGRDYSGFGYPNISFHGNEAYQVVTVSNGKELGIMFCDDKLIYIAYNMQWIGRKLALPKLKTEVEWKVVMKTCTEEPFLIKQSSLLNVPPRSVVVLEALLEKVDETKAKHITAF